MGEDAAAAAALGDERGHMEPYESPMLVDLGTLAELTLGGAVAAPDDGFGGAGDGGSF